MIKRLALTLLLVLALGPAAWAKNLTTENVVAQDSDSFLAAVNKHTAELALIYEHLNDLYKLQASTTCPAVGNTINDVCQDTSTSPPALKYWDGAEWQVLVNPAAYSSGLPFAAAVKGMYEGPPLERNGDYNEVAINATTTAPCTLEAGGDLLQVTSQVKVGFDSSADGTYYIYPIRTGATTAFTLGKTTTITGGVHYLGAVTVVAHVPVRTVSYSSYNLQRVQPALGMFVAYRLAAENRISSYNQLHHDTEVSDQEALFSSSTFTPTRRGWYEVNATETLAVSPAITVHCVKIVKGGVDVAETCTQGRYAQARGYFFSNGTTDSFTVYSRSVPDTTTATPTDDAYANGFWGRWIGAAY